MPDKKPPTAQSKRDEQHAKLLKEAMKHPCVKEFLEVYGDRSGVDYGGIYPDIVGPRDVIFSNKSA